MPPEKAFPPRRISSYSLHADILLHSQSQAEQMQHDLQLWVERDLPALSYPERTPALPEVIGAALEDLQPDTLNELTRGMIRMLGFKKKRWDELENTDRGRVALFAILADVFNKGDRVIERTTALLDAHTGSIMGSDLLLEVYHKKPIITFTAKDSQLCRVSASEMLHYAQDLANALGIDTGAWPACFNTMLQTQSQAMDILKRNREMGTITYSVEFALQYRKQTVAQYFRLLAESLYDDPELQQKFLYELLWIQRVDDLSDIYQDVWTQVNPYVALLHWNRLLPTFIEYHYKHIHPHENHVLLLWSANWFALRHPVLLGPVYEIGRKYRDM